MSTLHGLVPRTPLSEGARRLRGLPARGRLRLPPRIAATAGRLRLPPASVMLPALGLAAVAVALRAFRLSEAFDIFVDEITYLRISENVARHLSVALYGRPFYLHPPGFFFLEAGFLSLIRPSGDVIDQVQAVRYLNVALAGATAALLFLIARRLMGTVPGLLAGGIYALDPFVIRFSSRNLLEAATIVWVLVGLLVLAPSLTGDRAPSRARAVAVGMAFGAAILTKEVAVFLTLLPLAVCFARGWSLPRRTALLIAAVAVASYLLYPLVVALTGTFDAFQEQKLRGLLRMVGVIQETGFNHPDSPSFVATILGNLGTFAPTYLVMGLEACAMACLLWPRRNGRAARDPSREAVNRFLGVFALSSFILLGYAIAFGTLEEQMFYFLNVPASLALCVAVPQLLSLPWLSPRLRAASRRLVAALALVFVATSVGVWVQTRNIPDDGYERLVAYMREQVPPGSRVSATTQTSEFLLSGYQVGKWVTSDSLSEQRVQFVVVSSKQAEEGYAFGSPSFFRWVEANGTEVFSFTGPSNGRLSLYRLPAAAPVAGGSVHDSTAAPDR